MSQRERAIELGNRLGDRPLIYFGPRGRDAEPLAVLPNFERVFCMIAPGDVVETHCLERLSRVRPELNGYSFDEDRSQAAQALRSELLESKAGCVLLPYAASRIGSETWITRRGEVEYLGLFDEVQLALGHKPWVETSLRAAGVRVVPWIYTDHPRTSSIPREWRGSPLVVREGARSQGGIGLRLLRSADELHELSPLNDAGSYYSISKLINEAIPVNVNACVFADGRTALHGCSVQLIGLDLCTAQPFGFCGNDFGAVQAISPVAVRHLDALVREVGRWLAAQGYRGAFGIDALVDDEEVYFVEVNARFQASSPLAAMIDRRNGRSDQFLHHIASYLGLEPSDSASLPDLLHQQPTRSQIFVFNTRGTAVGLSGGRWSRSDDHRLDLVPEPGVAVLPGALLARLSVEGSVTHTGSSLREPTAELVSRLIESFCQSDCGTDH